MKIRKQGNWERWKSSSAKHNIQILAINIGVILSVFIFAAIIQSF